MGNSWTKRDQNLLMKYYDEGLSTKEIGEKLCRTAKAVQSQHHMLKYKKKKPVWTDGQIRSLEINYKGHSIAQLVELTGLTTTQIRYLARKLGLKKEDTICWTCDRAYADRCPWIETGSEREITKMGGTYTKQRRKSSTGTSHIYEMVRVDECPGYVPDNGKGRRATDDMEKII